MEVRKLCLFNKRKGSFLSSSICVVDTILEPLVWSKSLAPSAGTGIWLKPFRGIPNARWLPAIDLAYLDECCRVLKGIEFSPDAHSAPLHDIAESVLILPPHTLSSSQTHAGDELIVCAAEELARLLAGRSAESRPDSDSSIDRSGRHPVLVSVQSNKQSVESFEAMRSPTMSARLLRWLYPELERLRERERWRTLRFIEPNVDAYFWTGGAPEPHKIREIGCDGFYMLHRERWPIGTRMRMTLQRANECKEGALDWISVESKVIGWGQDGMSFEFSPLESEGRARAGIAKARARVDSVEGFVARLSLNATPEANTEVPPQKAAAVPRSRKIASTVKKARPKRWPDLEEQLPGHSAA